MTIHCCRQPAFLFFDEEDSAEIFSFLSGMRRIKPMMKIAAGRSEYATIFQKRFTSNWLSKLYAGTTHDPNNNLKVFFKIFASQSIP